MTDYAAGTHKQFLQDVDDGADTGIVYLSGRHVSLAVTPGDGVTAAYWEFTLTPRNLLRLFPSEGAWIKWPQGDATTDPMRDEITAAVVAVRGTTAGGSSVFELLDDIGLSSNEDAMDDGDSVELMLRAFGGGGGGGAVFFQLYAGAGVAGIDVPDDEAWNPGGRPNATPPITYFTVYKNGVEQSISSVSFASYTGGKNRVAIITGTTFAEGDTVRVTGTGTLPRWPFGADHSFDPFDITDSVAAAP